MSLCMTSSGKLGFVAGVVAPWDADGVTTGDAAGVEGVEGELEFLLVFEVPEVPALPVLKRKIV